MEVDGVHRMWKVLENSPVILTRIGSLDPLEAYTGNVSHFQTFETLMLSVNNVWV